MSAAENPDRDALPAMNRPTHGTADTTGQTTIASSPGNSYPNESDSSYGALKLVGLFLGPVLFLALLWLPLPWPGVPMQRLTAVLALVIVFWMTEAIPLAATALIGPALCILLGVARDREVLAAFGSPVIFKYIGMFFLTAAMQKHGLDRRLALAILNLPIVSHSPWRVCGGLAFLSAALGMWMNPLSTTAVMLPIAIGVINTSRAIGRNPEARQGLVLLIAYAASIGGITTPVGTAPNIITVGHLQELTGARVSTIHWMLLAAPLAIILICYLLWRLRPTLARDEGESVALAREFAQQQRDLGPLKPSEIATGLALGGAIFLWLVPGICELLGLDGKAMGINSINDDMVGLCAGLVLFVVPTNLRRGVFVLSWREGAKIDWGTIMLAAGGLSLGALIFSTGLAAAMGDGLSKLLRTTDISVVIAVGVVLSVAISEIASNTAAANVTVPLMIALSQSAGVDPVPVALACAFGCTFGFMLPVSSGPNTLAYATGEVRVRGMMRHGLALDIVGIAAIWLTIKLLSPLLDVMPKSL